MLVAALLLTACASRTPVSTAPATTVEKTVPSGPVTPAMILEIEERYGPVAAHRARVWQELIDSADALSEREKLERVNDFFNGADFVDDTEAWGREDYWATPLEFIIRDAGDCEDFAMAKYFTLRQMGFDDSRLRLMYCTARSLAQPHMVVTVYDGDGGAPLVLDNIDRRIRPARERADLDPVYSFNGEALWLARSRTNSVRAGEPGQLGPWNGWRERAACGCVPAVPMAD